MLSIIIVNYNYTTIDLFKCLKSLNKQVYSDFEVIIVDNNSLETWKEEIKTFLEKDASIERIRSKIQFHEESRNSGYTGGNNIGMKKAIGDIILLLNPDTLHGPDFLEKMVSLFTKYPNLHVAQPKINFNGNRDEIQSCGGIIKPYKVNDITHKYFGKINHEITLKPIYFIDFAFGCCLFIRKKVLKSIGLLDKSMFMYSEELDLCLRGKRHGFHNIICFTDVTIYHDVGREISNTYKIFKDRNQVITYFKNYTIPVIFMKLILKLMSIIAAAVDRTRWKIDPGMIIRGTRGYVNGIIIGLRRRTLENLPFIGLKGI